jgi:hypothetical protein
MTRAIVLGLAVACLVSCGDDDSNGSGSDTDVDSDTDSASDSDTGRAHWTRSSC